MAILCSHGMAGRALCPERHENADADTDVNQLRGSEGIEAPLTNPAFNFYRALPRCLQPDEWWAAWPVNISSSEYKQLIRSRLIF